jgi:hypothetical protein
MSFEDSVGATIGDVITVASECDDQAAFVHVRTDVYRPAGEVNTKLARGQMSFSVRADDSRPMFLGPPASEIPTAQAYVYDVPSSLNRNLTTIDLIGLQGTSRELFLLDHAPEVLTRIACKDLILQTTYASIEICNVPPASLDGVRIEMRLDMPPPRSLRPHWRRVLPLSNGQMLVRFDYYHLPENGPRRRFAIGRQVLSCKNSLAQPMILPGAIVAALRAYAVDPTLLAWIDDFLLSTAVDPPHGRLLVTEPMMAQGIPR